VKRLRRQLQAAAALMCLIFAANSAPAQGSADSTAKTYGTYVPNEGFRLAATENGTLNLRVYTYLRYLNQKGLDPTYTDSFGDTTTLDRRQDIQMQKVVVFFQGWLMDPNFRYLAYVWTSNTSQGLGAQVVVGGNLHYIFSPYLTVGGGIENLPGVRSCEGSFPFWLTVDNRLMADEFFRGSFTQGVWAKGKVVDRLSYRIMLGNNLSQLGVDAGQLDDGLNTVATALIWLPSTGEFGTAGEFGDFDTHQKAATRLAAHFLRSDEDRQGQANTDAFENVQIRISDGNSIFKPNLFAPGVQVDKAAYQMVSTDGGVKYRGLSLDGEYYWRRVDNLRGPGIETLGFEELKDNGFQLQASGMIVPQTLQGYAGLSKVFGEYGDPWDLRFGLNWFPWHNHVVRWNTEYLYTDRSPVGGLSLPTTVGGTGEILYSSFQVNF
jgi:hypothetical protein